MFFLVLLFPFPNLLVVTTQYLQLPSKLKLPILWARARHHVSSRLLACLHPTGMLSPLPPNIILSRACLRLLSIIPPLKPRPSVSSSSILLETPIVAFNEYLRDLTCFHSPPLLCCFFRVMDYRHQRGPSGSGSQQQQQHHRYRHGGGSVSDESMSGQVSDAEPSGHRQEQATTGNSGRSGLPPRSRTGCWYAFFFRLHLNILLFCFVVVIVIVVVEYVLDSLQQLTSGLCVGHVEDVRSR